MSNFHYISNQLLDLPIIKELIESKKKLKLSDEAILNIKKSRDYLISKIKNNNEPIYGINTGFGSLCNVIIEKKNLSKLQENLVMSHACGTGDFVPKPIVKLMLFLKIQSLSFGYSGVQLETVLRLIDFYNNDILPVVYTQGSLGASGDLAPLAHLSLPLLGKGEVYVGDKIIDIELALLFDRIIDLGYKLTLTKKAKDYIVDKGFDKKYGARPLKRAIQKYVEDALAEEIINSKLKEGDTITMDLDKKENKLTIKIKKQKKATET